MGAISNLRHCRDLTADHAAEAAGSVEMLTMLLERVAQVARPGDGGAMLLFTLGRIASSSRWRDAGLCVEITGDDVETALEIYADHGATRERVVPTTMLAVPIDEFMTAVREDP